MRLINRPDGGCALLYFWHFENIEQVFKKNCFFNHLKFEHSVQTVYDYICTCMKRSILPEQKILLSNSVVLIFYLSAKIYQKLYQRLDKLCNKVKPLRYLFLYFSKELSYITVSSFFHYIN